MMRERGPAQQHTQQRCRDCEALHEELAQLRSQSQQQARQDHSQCLLMFQQVQQLAKLNASLIQRCNGTFSPSILSIGFTSDESPSSQIQPLNTLNHRNSPERLSDDSERERLQALVVLQAHELKALHKKLATAIPIPPGCQVEQSKLVFNGQLGDLESSHYEPQDAQGSEASEPFSYAQEQQRARLQSHLRQLPLTSMNAQLKSKDAEILRLQQLAAKLEAQASAIGLKKREMAREYQRITSFQQLQLKKYFCLLQKLTSDKKSVERKLVELGGYNAVLEKKLVVASQDIREACGSTSKLREPYQSHTSSSNRGRVHEKAKNLTVVRAG